MAILREQKTRHDCGPTCFANTLNLLGFNISIRQANKICGLTLNGTNSEGLAKAFKKYNFYVEEKTYYSQNRAMNWLIKATNNGTPIIISVDQDVHWALVLLSGKNYIQLLDPEDKYPKLITKNELINRWAYYKESRDTPIFYGLGIFPEGQKAIKAVKMRAALIATSDVK